MINPEYSGIFVVEHVPWWKSAMWSVENFCCDVVPVVILSIVWLALLIKTYQWLS